MPPRQRRSQAQSAAQIVVLTWECTIWVDGTVTWDQDPRVMPLLDEKYKPKFRAREMPVPWDGMIVRSTHLVKIDDTGEKRAGKLVEWHDSNGRSWVKMDVPSSSRAAPLPTQAQIQQGQQG